MDLEDQAGDIDGRGTGNERTYIDYIGYKADNETAVVPLNSAINYRAYFSQGSGLYGPKVSKAVDGSDDLVQVLFRTVIMDFEDQTGDLDSRGTGNERAYIDYVGYKADNETATVPQDGVHQLPGLLQPGFGALWGEVERADRRPTRRSPSCSGAFHSAWWKAAQAIRWPEHRPTWITRAT